MKVLLIVALVLAAAQAATNNGDRNRLIAFYDATGGDSWTNTTEAPLVGWPDGDPCDDGWTGVTCNGAATERITGILLPNRRVSGEIASLDLGGATQLFNLDLSGNQIRGPIPGWIANRAMTTLDIDGNTWECPLPSGSVYPATPWPVSCSCYPGSANDDENSECVKCIAGYVQPGDAPAGTECEICPPGSFGPGLGGSVCRLCGENTYNPEEGSAAGTACLDCPEGTVADVGSAACVEPPAFQLTTQQWVAVSFLGSIILLLTVLLIQYGAKRGGVLNAEEKVRKSVMVDPSKFSLNELMDIGEKLGWDDEVRKQMIEDNKRAAAAGGSEQMEGDGSGGFYDDGGFEDDDEV